MANGVLTPAQIKSLFVARGGAPAWANYIAARAMRESGGRPNIDNSHTGPGGGKLNKNGTIDTGLLGINDVWRKDPVIGPLFRSGAIRTAAGGIDAAIRVLSVQGPSAWGDSGKPVPRVGPAQNAGTPPTARSATTAGPASTAGANGPAMRDLVAQFVMNGGTDNPSAVMGLATGLKSAQGGPTKTAVKVTAPPKASPIAATGNAPQQVQQIIQRANAINAKHYNYEWGGGHNPQGAPTHGIGHGSGPGVGFDCSGVVSKIFGINPLVASQFEGWGQGGKGQYVTVYANGTHTFLEINGHFFGTSSTNPGGGAGWIPRGALPASYLAGFVARHPQGL